MLRRRFFPFPQFKQEAQDRERTGFRSNGSILLTCLELVGLATNMTVHIELFTGEWAVQTKRSINLPFYIAEGYRRKDKLSN